ncbi:TetR/AcrR family transcriptional regulator [Agromyces tropicus]|uniref:TetR/AcrR family transcriptional regulator n=1 Tax=Agromyces tropicus TaxID=555371 RepID=A0ABN2U402_9MICO
MSTRGPYAKGVAKRREILDAALQVIAEHGYSGATVKEIAEAVGLSQNGLMHYFGSKDDLFVEVLRRRDEVDAAEFGPSDAAGGASAGGAPTDGADGTDGTQERAPHDLDGLRRGLIGIVDHNADVPGLVHLFVRLTADGSEPEHSAHAFFGERYAQLRSLGRDWITGLQERGEIRADVDPEAAAGMLFALIDGLQNQWIYDPDVDMSAQVSAFVDLLRP